jgi:predicted glycosyltransferase
MRPPSISANYHDPRSEKLFRECLEVFGAAPGVLCLIVNRTEAERRLIPTHLLNSGAARILESAVDGLQLLWASDLVVSGGGTMNREAALLGVPTYSVFTGRRPAMDERLVQMGKLRFVQCRRDIEMISVIARDRTMQYARVDKNLAGVIADIILEFNARGK